MPQLDRDGEVFVLDLGADENRFHPDWVASVSGLLEEVAAADGPRALVTAATGKFWSNGLDLDWLFSHPDDAGQTDRRVAYCKANGGFHICYCEFAMQAFQ